MGWRTRSHKASGAAVVVLAVLAALGVGACTKRAATGTAAPQTAIVDGLKIEEIKTGVGPVASKGKIVSVHYTGYLPGGATFDTTLNRQPLQFQLGEGTVLKGWDLGVDGMKVGGKRKLTLAPELAFGGREVGQIKPNSMLVFDVELVAVK